MTGLIRNTRHGVFETNSSSTHSISISDTGSLLDILKVDDEGNVIVTPAEFGWEQEEYTDANSKASYLYVYCRDWSGDKEEEFLENLKEAILEQTKAESVIFRDGSNTEGDYGYDDGYIDHQSVEGRALDYILEDKRLIRDFIFNPNSILTTDNDNH